MFILILLSYKFLKIYDSSELGAFPCLALGAQISPPAYLFIFFLNKGGSFYFCFYAYFRLDKG